MIATRVGIASPFNVVKVTNSGTEKKCRVGRSLAAGLADAHGQPYTKRQFSIEAQSMIANI
jgi:hypothetical protein